jgi:beta-glucosidase
MPFRLAAVLAAVLVCVPALAQPADRPDADALYRDADTPIEDRVADLVGRMTLEEKVGQLNQYTAAGSATATSSP